MTPKSMPQATRVRLEQERLVRRDLLGTRGQSGVLTMDYQA
jgi:hypothetical protein